MKVKTIGVAAAMLLCGACLFSSAETGTFVFAINGEPQCTIVSNGNNTPAKELAKYLGQVIGKEVAVVSNETDVAEGRGKIVIQIGEALSDDNEYIEMQSFSLRAGTGRMTITGPTKEALLYGVFSFLEDHVDCRFFSTRPEDEYIPSNPNLALAAFRDEQKPAFQIRGAVWGVSRNRVNDYKFRAGGFPKTWVLPGHNISDWAKQVSKNCPNALAVYADGSRCNWSLCGTNEDGIKELGRCLVEAYEKNKFATRPEEERFLAISQMDGSYVNCHCEKCQALIKSEGTEMAPLFNLANRALDEAQKTYPDLSAGTYAYFNTLYPPKTLKANPKFWVCVVSSSLSQNQSGDQLNGICESPSNRHYCEAIKAWSKYLEGRTSIYHWSGPDPGNNGSEWPNTFVLCENYRYWRDCGLTCGQFEALPSRCDLWGVGWLTYRMLWNPDLDYKALLRDSFDKRFGKPAAKYLWEYLEFVDQVRREVNFPVSCVRWPSFIYVLSDKLWYPEAVTKMNDLFVKAAEAAKKEGNPKHISNVSKARALSLDKIFLTAGRNTPFEFVTDPDTGKQWVIHGHDSMYLSSLKNFAYYVEKCSWWPQTPEERMGAELRDMGGEVRTLKAGGYEAAVVPWLKGTLHSLKKDGVELFSQHNGVSGYRDTFWGSIITWVPQEGATADSLTQKALINTAMYRSGYGKFWFEQDQKATPNGFKIARRYHQGDYKKEGIGPGIPDWEPFPATFCLKLADVSKAAVGVKGEGFAKAIALAGLDTSGGPAVSAKRGADLLDADCQNPLYDRAEEIPVGKDLSVELPTNGTITVTFARGDGVTVTIETVASARCTWKAVEFKPDPDNGCIDINFHSYSAHAGKEALDMELPPFTITAAGKPRPVTAQKREEPKLVTKMKKIDADHAINEIDGAKMIRIPAGKFKMGTAEGEGCRDEWPLRDIELDEYWIYEKPVTVGMYKKFCEATGRKFVPTWCQSMILEKKERNLTDDDYPVCLSWNEAEPYARWAGMRLPTEAQWVKAARGDKDAREYPWGDQWDGTKAVGWEMTLEKFRDGMLPSGSVPEGKSPYGLFDMAGNRFEWVRDWYDPNYIRTMPAKNPSGPEKGTSKVVKGGDSGHGEDFARISFRYLCPPSARDWTKISFRCVSGK